MITATPLPSNEPGNELPVERGVVIAPSGSCRALVTASTKTPELSQSLPSGGCWAPWSRLSDQPPQPDVHLTGGGFRTRKGRL